MLKKKIWWLSGLLALLCILSVTELTAAGVYAQKWLEATVGTNLALGKKVIFSMTPKYGLTSKNGTDAVDLTDGLLATYPEDKIWFDDKAVGWWEGSRATEGINLLLDLGKESKVDRVVIRCLGGSEQNSLHAPKQFDVFVSKDGVKFYQTASLQKLEPSERAQSDFNKYYFLEEQQVAWVYPFVLAVQADARYIGVRIRCKTDSLFIDELAVMEATPGEGKKSGFNKAYSGEANAFVTRGIIVKPRINKLVISTNIPTPTSLIIQDMRDAATAKNTAQLVMELPEGITITTTTQQTVQSEKIKLGGRDYTRFTMPLILWDNRPQTPMFFFKAEKTPAPGAQAVFYALCDGEVPLKQTVPVELIVIPEVTPALKRLHVSLTWMGEGFCLDWPDFFTAWRTLGFNAVAFFPHWWSDTSLKGAPKLLIDSREKGFKIVMCDSPMHRMAEQPGGNVPGCELYSQVPAGNSTNVCPSYRGVYYTKELARVAAMVTKTHPDFVFWDIELWYDGAMDARAGRCSRCVAGQVASGKPMEAYLIDQATQSLKDLYDAVATSSVGFTMPVVACYDYHPYRNFHNSVADFNQIYPRYINQAQPSLYVAGNAQAVHDSIRGNYRLMKDKQIVPWLSTGTYGEIDPRKAEHQVLETLLNGASGLTYFWYGDFDTPLEFYYHAKALAEIAPYEDLIMDGEVLEPTGTNDKLYYSGIRKGNEMLLLVGNYQKDPASTVYTAPFTTVTQIKDLRSGKTVPAVNPIKLDLPKDEIQLLYITGK